MQDASHGGERSRAAQPGAHQRGEGGGQLQRIAFICETAAGDRVVDEGGKCGRIALTRALREAVAAQLDAVAHGKHTGGIDMPVTRAACFDGFERAEQALRDLTGLLGREGALAQHLGECLVEGLHDGIDQRFIL
jgi:hypothetical protein